MVITSSSAKRRITRYFKVKHFSKAKSVWFITHDHYKDSKNIQKPLSCFCIYLSFRLTNFYSSNCYILVHIKKKKKLKFNWFRADNTEQVNSSNWKLNGFIYFVRIRSIFLQISIFDYRIKTLNHLFYFKSFSS